MQIFKEAYLPTIILAVTIVMILVFIIGSVVREPEEDPQLNAGSNPSQAQTQPSVSTPAIDDALTKEAKQLLEQANALAQQYDYEGAVAVLEGFSGERANFPALDQAYKSYTDILSNMVAWDAMDVYNLSVHQLIADSARAFPDQEYGKSYKNNFITIREFSAILQQLYDNGYVLVQLSDFYAQEFNPSLGRDVFVTKKVMLPAGKKPLMLTQTHANYYNYMIDSNKDGQPDAGADGFACSLRYDGRFYNELVNADGSISTGSFDVIPMLEDFIAEHPTFSYKGARAIISFTGYDGVLGYRVNSSTLSADALQKERDELAKVVAALKEKGYLLGCYTFDNYNYGTTSANGIKNDLDNWKEEITPWLGEVDILVFARDGDIGDENAYDGSKFNVVYSAGFRYFLGTSQTPWNQVDNLYVRHNRLSITGANLQNHADWFAPLFDAATVLDPDRG